MQLASLINPDFIRIKVKAASKAELITILLDTVYANYDFALEKKQIQEALEEREALGATTLGSGIAIPHARIDNFNDTLIAIAIPETEILDKGQPLKLMVMLLTSKTSSNLYLHCLAAFVKLSKQDDQLKQLCTASSAQEVKDYIQSLNLEVKTELTLDSIMTKQCICLGPDETLRTAVNLFKEKQISYVPVIDAKGELLGELEILEILKLGIPGYAQMIGNISFLKSFEPLEELLSKEDTMKVKDLMSQPSTSFKPDTSVVEAVFTFTKTRKRHIPVVEGNELKGIVSYMDILFKVLRP